MDNSVQDQASSRHSDTTYNSDDGDSLIDLNITRSFEVLDDLPRRSGPINVESQNASSYSIGLTQVISDLERINAQGREASIDALESTQEQVEENGVASQIADINSMEMREDSGQRMRRILQETAANFLYREVPQIDAEDHTSIPDVESSIQQIDTREKNDDIGVLSDHSRSFQDNDLENVDPLESTSHEELNEDLGMGVEPNDWQAYGFQRDEWKIALKKI